MKSARRVALLGFSLFAFIAPACASAPASNAPPRGAPTDAAPRVQPPAAPAPMPLAQTGIEPAWMDATVDPCVDYFAYACGGFVKTTEIPADRSSWSTSAAIDKTNEEFLKETLERAAASPGDDANRKKIGDYYAACTDEAAIEKAGIVPIAPLLASAAAVKSFATLATAVATLHGDNVFAIFDVSAVQDFKDATRMIAALDQNGLGLPDRDYYLRDDGNLKEIREFYTAHVGRMLALAQASGAPIAATELNAATADVLRIEGKLAKIQQTKVARRDPYKIYHPVDRAALQSVARTFPWGGYFKALGLADAGQMTINDPAYFAGVDALLHQEPPAAWRHYLTWQILRAKASMLGNAFVNEKFAMRQKLTGQKELAPRWKRCVHGVDDALGELLGQPYVAAKFAGDSKARAKELVGAIHTAMRTDLNLLPWMDDSTRTAALQKLEKMNDKVGYPDTWRVYDFTVSRSTYAANAMAAERFELHRRLTKIGKPVDRTEWDMSPPTVNASYTPSLNEIALPAGELQAPFFSKDFYPPVNIGDEGANTIGHEITHAFDDEGSQYDGDGNLRDWWSKETKAKFVSATKCVVDQYSNYDAIPGVKLNGELTAGENIADIGGVKLGYAALVAWKAAHPEEHRAVGGATDERIFFLAYAQGWCSKETPQFLEMLARTDPHSPPRLRVNGPLADVPAFADAYACKKGTPMNGPIVCAVW